MDAEREREIRELAARLIGSKRHRKIGIVLGDLLGEIDLLRQDDESMMTYVEAKAILEKWAERGYVKPGQLQSGTSAWRKAVEAKAHLYQ